VSRLIISARYWNDIEWLEASLQHVEYWQADKVYLSEGNWSQAYEARSTDGTREKLERFTSVRKNVFVIDNVRDDENYRVNQANTSNLVMKLAGAEPGDWMLIIDVDHFYFKKDIDYVKKLIQKSGNKFDYITLYTYNFLYSLRGYNLYYDKNGTKLPYKLLKNCTWRETNHLCVGEKAYSDIPQLKSKRMRFAAMHYEGLRLPDRLKDKYSIGDRKSFEEYKGGIKVKDMRRYRGRHPEFVVHALKSGGYLNR